MHAADLEAVLQPEALGFIGHVRELGADGAAVDVLQLRDDLAQLEPGLDRAVAAARQELGVEVGFGEPEVVESQHLRYRTHREAERIDVRDQVATIGVNLDEPRDGALLGRGRIAQRRRARGTRRDGPGRQRPTRGPGATRQFFDQRAVGDVLRRRSECREVLAPRRVDRLGARQVGLVHRFDVRVIAGGQRDRRQHCFCFSHRFPCSGPASGRIHVFRPGKWAR